MSPWSTLLWSTILYTFRKHITAIPKSSYLEIGNLKVGIIQYQTHYGGAHTNPFFFGLEEITNVVGHQI